MSKKEGRKAIGLDLYPPSKSKKKYKQKEKEKPLTRRSPDPCIQKYIKQKKKTRKIADLQKQFQENLKERERLHGLEKLDKTLRIKPKQKKKKKFKRYANDEKSTDPCYSFLNITKNKAEEKYSNFFSEKLRKLQERVYTTYDSIKIEAVIKIQRWFRSIIKNKNYTIKQRFLTLNNSESSSAEIYLKTECDE